MTLQVAPFYQCSDRQLALFLDGDCQTSALIRFHMRESFTVHTLDCSWLSIDGQRESAEVFLRRLNGYEPEIRVLLDVGASLKPHISAAVFFNESDDLTVLTQTIEPFISSPFSRKLDECIVYLGDAHTRGTDLKLPKGTRAAVTLGPKVTKDRLLQGESLCK